MFSPRHIPALFIGTALTFGGMIPFFNGASAMKAFGLPPRISSSEPAQVVMAVNGARNVALGLAIFSLYAQGMLHGVDVVMGCIGVAGLLDEWICWKAGVLGTGIFRAGCGVLVGGWGWLGLSSGS